jgi:hypothetical protein
LAELYCRLKYALGDKPRRIGRQFALSSNFFFEIFALFDTMRVGAKAFVMNKLNF